VRNSDAKGPIAPLRRPLQWDLAARHRILSVKDRPCPQSDVRHTLRLPLERTWDSKGHRKPMILAPLFDLSFLIRPGAPPCRNFKSAALTVPKPGSALHHLVTSVSVKKALTMRLGIDAPFDSAGSVKRGQAVVHRRRSSSDAFRTHLAKMRSGARLSDCADGFHEGIVTIRFENALLPFSCPV
jgi:hypothetical protein